MKRTKITLSILLALGCGVAGMNAFAQGKAPLRDKEGKVQDFVGHAVNQDHDKCENLNFWEVQTLKDEAKEDAIRSCVIKGQFDRSQCLVIDVHTEQKSRYIETKDVPVWGPYVNENVDIYNYWCAAEATVRVY